MDLGDDKLKEDLQTMLEDTEYAIAHSAEKQASIINSMLSKVVGNYQTAFDKINSIIGNTGWVGSNDFQQNSKLEDILFSIIQKLPEKLISPAFMQWLDNYITKRTAELQHQIIKCKWQQADLESILTKLHNQYPQDTSKK